MKVSVSFIVILITLTSVSSKITETEEVKNEGKKFIQNNLDLFLTDSKDRLELNNYFKDLLDFISEANNLNNPMEKTIAKITNQLNSLEDQLRQGRYLKGIVNEMEETVNNFRFAAKIYYHSCKYGYKWIEKRVSFIRNQGIKRKLSDVLLHLLDAKHYIKSKYSVLVDGIQKIKQLINERVEIQRIKQVIEQVKDELIDFKFMNRVEQATNQVEYLIN